MSHKARSILICAFALLAAMAPVPAGLPFEAALPSIRDIEELLGEASE
ncbi:MAG: hypothetical protein IFK94_04425 [Acidobacteria bacterium]|uniref:Uncharacterized protein n=1 Tax=Candidatus Polarisedimenticola svalbardensis TaxID=2886004 RepID=A0A8J6XT63_9BACT|nr:hypothetical protein [Candidatus Polarisedimenticola svalbardensis]